MAKKGSKAQGRGRSARAQAARRRWYIGGGALAVVLAVVFFILANRPPAAEGYYRYSNPGEIAELIGTGAPVLVYFHSPT